MEGVPYIVVIAICVILFFGIGRYITTWMFGTRELIEELQATNKQLAEISTKIDRVGQEIHALRMDIQTDRQVEDITTLQQPPTTPRY